jgi:hypothetical protein
MKICSVFSPVFPQNRVLDPFSSKVETRNAKVAKEKNNLNMLTIVTG